MPNIHQIVQVVLPEEAMPSFEDTPAYCIPLLVIARDWMLEHGMDTIDKAHTIFALNLVIFNLERMVIANIAKF